MNNQPEWTGLQVAITGGANGIGQAMVHAFHKRGARVSFCDMDDQSGKRLAASLGPNAAFHRVDLRSEMEIKRWIRHLTRRGAELHALINNAACDPRIPLPKVTRAAWDELLAVNLRAYFLTCREAAPHMPRNAAIVNFSSITFHISPADMSTYVATKGGIIGLSRALARELGAHGIRVNTLSPGWVMTERQRRQFVTPAVRRMLRRSQCIPDLIQPDEVAEVAVFLCSPASRAITGQEIVVDRGWTHH